MTILGPSGCGKSTLLRIVAGWISDHGQVVLDDQPVEGPGADRGIVFPELRCLAHHQAEHPLWPAQARHAGLAEQKTTSDYFISKVGLRGFEQHFKQLSGGMQQRTAIARANERFC